MKSRTFFFVIVSFFSVFHFPASAMTGYNVNESMDALIDLILEKKGY